MDKVNPIVFVVKRLEGNSGRFIVLDSWESVSHFISDLNGISDCISIYRCEVHSFK